MKILAIVGSLRQDSVNRKAAKAFASVVPDGVTCSLAEIKDIPPYDQDVQAAGFPPAVDALAAAVKAADAIVFATPEYNYSIPGVLKNAIDWLSRHPDAPLTGKPAAIMGASPGKLGTARAQYHLRQVGIFLDIHWLNRPEVMISEAYGKFDATGALTDEPTRAHLAKMAVALVAHAKRFEG